MVFYPNAIVGAYWSFTEGVLYPAPTYLSNPTASILLVDPLLYQIGNFFRNITASNMLPRFAEDMYSAGIKTSNLANYQDGYAVAELVAYKLTPTLLKTNAYKFPLMGVWQSDFQPVQFTTVKTGAKRTFQVSWIMPPMGAKQVLYLQSWMSLLAKTWIAYGPQGYDPKLSDSSVWLNLGVAYGEIHSLTLNKPFAGQELVDGKLREADFPTVTMTLSFWEINQLGLPQNYPGPFSGAVLKVGGIAQGADGYGDGYMPAFYIDGYTNGLT